MNSELNAPWDPVSGFPPLAHIIGHSQDLTLLKRHSVHHPAKLLDCGDNTAQLYAALKNAKPSLLKEKLRLQKQAFLDTQILPKTHRDGKLVPAYSF